MRGLHMLRIYLKQDTFFLASKTERENETFFATVLPGHSGRSSWSKWLACNMSCAHTEARIYSDLGIVKLLTYYNFKNEPLWSNQRRLFY